MASQETKRLICNSMVKFTTPGTLGQSKKLGLRELCGFVQLSKGLLSEWDRFSLPSIPTT